MHFSLVQDDLLDLEINTNGADVVLGELLTLSKRKNIGIQSEVLDCRGNVSVV